MHFLSSASTEKLLQISTKLNGLAAEAQSVTSNGTHAVLNEADKYVVNELEVTNTFFNSTKFYHIFFALSLFICSHVRLALVLKMY